MKKMEDIIEELRAGFGESCLNYNIVHENEMRIGVNEVDVRRMAELLCRDKGMKLACMFASDETLLPSGEFAIYYVFADAERGAFIIARMAVDSEKMSYPSVSDFIHSASFYEREIHDLFGIKAEGNESLKPMVFHGNWPEGEYPLRKTYDRSRKPAFASRRQEFMKVKGEGVYEIPVGPVHAGIIEPGHFRFSVAGEPIINLEAQLYFVHKGIEKMCEGMDFKKCFYVSERISGDETFSNALAYCQAVEKIAGVQIPRRAQITRVIFAELERLTSHLGDIGGVCLDIGYGFATFQFRMMRGWTYQLVEAVCTSRFLRSVNTPGGVRKDFLEGNEKRIIEMMIKIEKELLETIDIIKAKSLYIDRVENTGTLKKKTAIDLNATGPAGRASGVHYDVRKSFPYEAYGDMEFEVSMHNNGDVNCRLNVKLEECIQSIKLIMQGINMLESGSMCSKIDFLPPYVSALGYTESPRGENIHWIMSGENNDIYRYKVRTPSFCNWPALCEAVRGNIVPDFPIINKSFNLSYAGNDL
ncbi:formate hydrogenlyase subunit 5 [Peptoclostridium acidaminophilum DSM 3953]|uniref:Formate hydrogenlyase subunit 5 n=1 Tax=Peptoclostridium acidaminophilum DSM 3953 TaxID=1286171 RepID=W8TDT7_PEPAC|nr:NADH-quinone oxidoreductase subunit C [Peptoclostridium acidaminophilum]AHM55988.1 formate hydrogenlyase subunit 5 [Peptoclostridium acidaminophilum DSM 3953]